MLSIVIQSIICIILGYFIGCINPSYLMAKCKGFDIRSQGSGNAGASNAIITMGKSSGLICALFDIMKAFIAVRLSARMFLHLSVAGILSGVSCIMGHIFPVNMHFRGGKGLASLGGVILSYDARLFFCLLFLELLAAFILDYICIVPTSASVIFTVILAVHSGLIYAAIFSPALTSIIYRHWENFQRIQRGIEARFSYLWNKEKELARLQKNWELLPEDQKQRFQLKSI